MIASLPMYDRPANRAAHNKLWTLIRDNLRDAGVAAPDHLNRNIDHMAGWASPDLVLGQICNLPWRAKFRDRVTVIGAADYGVPDCPPGFYNSVFIVHRDTCGDDPAAFADATFACNDLLSNSGYGAAQLWAQARGFVFQASLITGSHAGSLAAVANGQAAIAAIDAQTWRMQQADDPHAKAVRLIGVTDSTPGMTFITRHGQNPASYFAAITDAIAACPAADRAILGLRGIVALPLSAYDIPFPPDPTRKIELTPS